MIYIWSAICFNKVIFFLPCILAIFRIVWVFIPGINRGYYMVARRYEISLREEKFGICKRPWNVLYLSLGYICGLNKCVYMLS